MIIFRIYILRFNIFLKFPSIENNISLKEINIYIKKYLSRQSFSGNNKFLIEKEKNNIFKFFSNDKNSTLKTIKKIFYKSNYRFGNILTNLNKLLFFCEIINCKSIMLDKNNFWFLKNKTKIPKSNITIEIGEYNKSFIFFNESQRLFFSFFIFKPEIRINYLRDEIISNLPLINISDNYLYIHVRSGDIFKLKVNRYYAQPPLCFYEQILRYNNFSKVYIIASDKRNLIIEKLINHFNNIIFSQNSLKYDISMLINAYNIVSSISSFLNLIIQLNVNLKFLWDFNIYKLSEKILLFHYDLYKYPHNNFTIFRMEPSSKYRTKMYLWKNNKMQRKLMIKEKCNKYFSIINKEI